LPGVSSHFRWPFLAGSAKKNRYSPARRGPHPSIAGDALWGDTVFLRCYPPHAGAIPWPEFLNAAAVIVWEGRPKSSLCFTNDLVAKD
jgi:hypothetical protein